MTPNDFIRRFLGLLPHQNYNEDTVRLLANVVDTTKDGLVSYQIEYDINYLSTETNRSWNRGLYE